MATKKRLLKLRTTPYPSKEDLKPFINGHEELTKGKAEDHTVAEIDPLSSLTPVNQESIRLGKKYREELPAVLESKIERTRQFFLNEIAPYLLACSNGLQDAKDVMESAFNEEADVQPLFNKIENAVSLAMDIRILHFAKEIAGLSEIEAKQFMVIAFSKELNTNEDITAKLLEMLASSSPEPERKKMTKRIAVKRAVKKPAVRKSVRSRASRS